MHRYGCPSIRMFIRSRIVQFYNIFVAIVLVKQCLAIVMETFVSRETLVSRYTGFWFRLHTYTIHSL